MLVIIGAMSWSTAYANGRVVTFDKRIAGPYEIAVGKIPDTPRVGNLHLTMTVTDVETATFVVGADVQIKAIGPDSSEVEIGPIPAPPDITDPVFYDVATVVDRIGIWNFTVEVDSELGNASADFPIEVQEVSPITGIVTIVALVAFVAVLGFAIRAFFKERGRSNRRNA